MNKNNYSLEPNNDIIGEDSLIESPSSENATTTAKRSFARRSFSTPVSSWVNGYVDFIPLETASGTRRFEGIRRCRPTEEGSGAITKSILSSSSEEDNDSLNNFYVKPSDFIQEEYEIGE